VRAGEGIRLVGGPGWIAAAGPGIALLDPVAAPHCTEWNPTGRCTAPCPVYLAGSASGLILRLPLDPTTGRLGEPRVFARLDGAARTVWRSTTTATCGRRSGVRRGWTATPRRRAHRVAPGPGPPATSVLITPDHRILVTSATVGLAHPGPADGLVLAATVDVRGRPRQAWGG
jgi:hypothetical protein